MDAALLDPLPLDRDRALALLAQLRAGTLPAIPGTFLCFLTIPVEERIGEWRYAGHAATLGGALVRLDELQRRMHDVAWNGAPEETPEPLEMLAELLAAEVIEMPAPPDSGYSYRRLGPYELGPHRVILLGEGGAPHDDTGFCVVEVPSAEHPLTRRAPEDQRPETWPAPGEEW